MRNGTGRESGTFPIMGESVKLVLFIAVVPLAVALPNAGATMLPIAPARLVRDAAVAFEGTPYAENVFRAANGCIYTETHIQVSRVYRGAVPDCVRMRHPGGQIGNDRLIENQSPTLVIGQPYLVLGAIRRDGTLCAREGRAGITPVPPVTVAETDPASRYAVLVDLLTQPRPADSAGAADVRSQASTWPVPEILPAGDLSLTANGISARFTAGDRGEPLTYVMDMDELPDGVSEEDAHTALKRALCAWENTSSTRFVSAGVMSLGKSAALFTGGTPADVLVQFHDIYGHITNAYTLGVGGRWTASNTNLLPNGGLGGRLGTNEFDVMRHAFIVLNHTTANLENLMTLEEVLTHEIGHNLSLAHSSDEPGETNTALNQAVMFYQAHEDGRGASLRSWDSNAVHQAYPPGNTAPYGYERVMHVLMASPPYEVGSGINEVKIPMFDLQSPVVAELHSVESFSGGTFTAMPDGTVAFYMSGVFASNYMINPADNSGYAWCRVRISDGTNKSAPVSVRVVSLLRDAATRDGVPDVWANAHSLGPAGNADNDPFTDRQEWLLDTDPTNDASGLVLSITETNITWEARPYAVYELLSTTNITDNFTRDRNPITPTGQIGKAMIDPLKTGSQFFRLRYLP